ncbi:MAG: hypothetical protein ACRDOC_07995, partial [Streptosporangiaceae bacterium]
MDSSDQNVAAPAHLPKPAALQDMPPQDVFATSTGTSIFDARGVSIYYGAFRAVTDVSLTVYENEITAFIVNYLCVKT